MKKISNLMMLFAAVALMTACSNDETLVQENGVGKVTVQIKGGSSTAVTRATQAGTAAESTINSLELYVFNADGSLDTKVGSQGTTPGTGYVALSGASLTGNNKYQFQVTAGTGKKVLAIANAGLGAQAGKTFTQIEQLLTNYVFGSANSQGQTFTDAASMEMAGVSEGWSVENGAVTAVDVKISRLAAKIMPPVATTVNVDFTNLLQEDIDRIYGTGSGLTPADTYTFTYQGYAVINGLKNSAVYTPANFSTWVGDTYYKPGAAPGAAPLANLYSWPTFDANGMFLAPPYSGGTAPSFLLTNAPIYVYENKPATGVDAAGQIGYVAGTVYAFIIGGTITGNGTGVTNKVSTTRYWRINIYATTTTVGADALPYVITRNTIYNTTINRVSSPGYSTPQNATGGDEDILPPPTSAAANFTIIPQDWNVLDETTEM
ncbi:MAG: hypothetical protein LBL78_06255 [Prevotellaceae bacterium]|jgi:hypothetical protein|nr:hypothetical protein [Prevotellaceae bacterium]